MAFMMKKREKGIDPNLEQCDRQLGQLEEQRRECFIDIGQLYARQNTVQQAMGTPYKEMLVELDRLDARMKLLEKRKLAIQNQRKCEKCGAILNLDSMFCNKCGEKLEEIAPEILTDEPLCPNCKQPIEEGSTFCTHCGANIEDDIKAQKSADGGNVCPSCGTACSATDVFCITCGEKLG